MLDRLALAGNDTLSRFNLPLVTHLDTGSIRRNPHLAVLSVPALRTGANPVGSSANETRLVCCAGCDLGGLMDDYCPR